MKKGVRRFLRITNYHCRFIKDYAQIAHPLHELTKDVPFMWEEAQQGAFDTLKKVLVMSQVLALPKDKGKLCLEMDASDVGMGAVLSQEQEDRTYWLLGYVLKSFAEAEQRYTTYDKELLGIMHALEDWRNLLIGALEPFEILMDHQNLTYF
jgi:hypothetical protein